MKKLLLYVTLALPLCYSLSSCYAFLHADKLVYQGTVGKKIPPLDVEQDSVTVKASVDADF